MKIKFIDYQENILVEAVDSKEPQVYVCDNFRNLKKAREYYQRPFLEKESIFITMADLKEKLFPTGKLVLKEEKRVILFYELLTEKEKEILGVNNYFDVIDLAANFFKFYNELNEYRVEEVKGLRKWQEEKFKVFQSIRGKYCKKLEELNYIDSTLAFDFKYFNDYFLKDYHGLTFVNIINFTPKERVLIDRLEESGYELQLFIQQAEKDYDQENLRIKSFSLPEQLSTEIELYHTEEEKLQLFNLLLLLDKEGEMTESSSSSAILDADFVSSNFERLLSGEKLQVDKEYSFTETNIYRFLESLFKLINTADLSNGELKLEIDTLLEACYQIEFREYYSLNIRDLKNLQKLAIDNYAYLSENLTDRSGARLKGFKEIISEIKKIYKIKDLQGFVDFLQDIDLSKLDDQKFSNEISQFYDSLLELHTIEEMGILSSWNRYFASRSQGFFRLVLNYLRFKEVKLIKESDGYKICDLINAPHLNQEKLYILNASRGVIPSESSNDLLLTEKQRKDNGLKTTEMKQLEERYYFFRHILSSRKAIIFSQDNLEENISPSSFLEELVLRYKLSIKETELGSEDYPYIIKNLFRPGERSFNSYLDLRTTEKDRLMVEEDDFQGEFSLAYYKYNDLKNCYYKFYLASIGRLEEERIEKNKELTPIFLGDLAHELSDTVFRRIGTNLEIEEEKVKEIIDKKLKSYYLKINNYYKKYYQDILFPEIEEGIIAFIKSFRQRINGQVREVLTEWMPAKTGSKYIYENGLVNIYLSGRIDLLINTDESSYLIDFKTGSGNLKQLDFYSLLLNPEGEEDNRIEKAIYKVFDRRFEYGRSGTELEFLEEIKEVLDEFFQGGEYSFEYKPSLCDRCIMKDICKVVR